MTVFLLIHCCTFFLSSTQLVALGSDDTVKKNVVVIGSSFIGMEAALASSKRANVTVVGMDKVPFEAILGKAIGGGIQKVKYRIFIIHL